MGRRLSQILRGNQGRVTPFVSLELTAPARSSMPLPRPPVHKPVGSNNNNILVAAWTESLECGDGEKPVIFEFGSNYLDRVVTESPPKEIFGKNGVIIKLKIC